jgi:predicted nucleic acid-binding Zn ribbon protein
MYCKSCGRQLKEGMRFCDRCGQSVRKNNQSVQTTKRREIEELKTERLNRKKRLAEKEAKQAKNKQRKKKKSNVFVFLIICILIALASWLIGYVWFAKDSTPLQADYAGQSKSSETAASATPTPTPASDTKLKSGYSSITIGNIVCPYPEDFSKETTASNEKLNLSDKLSGATMIIAQEGNSGEPKDLMKAYIKEKGGKVNDGESNATNDSYTVTIHSGGKVYHRKCIKVNNGTVYYDFTYTDSSEYESKYKEYINYIDANFK